MSQRRRATSASFAAAERPTSFGAPRSSMKPPGPARLFPDVGDRRVQRRQRAAVLVLGEQAVADRAGQVHRPPPAVELEVRCRVPRVRGGLHEAGDRAFAAMFELIEQGQAEGVIDPGEPERVALVLFATIQGIVSLVNSGIVPGEQLDELVASAVVQLLRGARTAA